MRNRNHTTVFTLDKKLFEVSEVNLIDEYIYLIVPSGKRIRYTIRTNRYGYYITVYRTRLYLFEIL